MPVIGNSNLFIDTILVFANLIKVKILQSCLVAADFVFKYSFQISEVVDESFGGKIHVILVPRKLTTIGILSSCAR
jgi:hypothetical protein